MRRRRLGCGGSPGSSPGWRKRRRRGRSGCWATAAGPCAKALSWRRRAGRAGGGRWTELAVTSERLPHGRCPDPQRLAGITPDGAARLVSLHDQDARPIAKGRLGKPSSSATKPRSPTTTTASSSITISSRATLPMPRSSRPPSSGSSTAPGRVPAAVTADRGYGEPGVERDLHALGVRTVVIPRKAKTAQGPQAPSTGGVPAHGQMADRLRRPDQQPETIVRGACQLA